MLYVQPNPLPLWSQELASRRARWRQIEEEARRMALSAGSDWQVRPGRASDELQSVIGRIIIMSRCNPPDGPQWRSRRRQRLAGPARSRFG